MVASLKDEILRMAAGNLRDSVPEMGQDEIGIIAEELDNLRTALQDTLVREKESRRANQDLITAMSNFKWIFRSTSIKPKPGNA